jgi:hypothetical protein
MSDVSASAVEACPVKRPSRSKRRTYQVARMKDALKERDAKIIEKDAEIAELENLLSQAMQTIDLQKRRLMAKR